VARACGPAPAGKSAAYHHDQQTHGYIWDFCVSSHIVPLIRQPSFHSLVGLSGENHDLACFNFNALNLEPSILSTLQSFRDISLPEGVGSARHQHPAFCSPSMRARMVLTISLFWLAPLRAASISSQIFIATGKRTKIAAVVFLWLISTPLYNFTVILISS
jgi:hypothetical protein